MSIAQNGVYQLILVRQNVENIGVKTPLCLTPTSDLKGCVSLLPSLTDR
jgi:hypothetical protein